MTKKRKRKRKRTRMKKRNSRRWRPEVCQAIGHVFPESVRKAFGEHVGENEHEEEEEYEEQ